MNDGHDVDPDLRMFQRKIAAGYGEYPNFADLPVVEQRAVAEGVRAPWRVGAPAMALTEELRVGSQGVRIRILRPNRSPRLPALLYLHGGGWTMFSIDSHEGLMREYAARAGITVIAIDYSLSPEARFPTAIEETLSVIAWARAEGRDHGIDSSRLAIGGDSAGANLAVAASIRLRDAGEEPLAAMLLNYGAYDGSGSDYYSRERYDGPAYNLTAAEMRSFWSNYVCQPAELADPLVSPIGADLEDLPPAFLTVAECDILADENRAFAQRLSEAGVPVTLQIYSGAIHSFLEAVLISSLAERALSEASSWLRACLAPPTVLLVGAGRMGQAFVRGWNGVAASSFFDPGVDSIEGVERLESLDHAARLPRPLVVMIAVKPQMIAQVAPALAQLNAPDTLFLSIAAGIEISTLRGHLGKDARIVRAMPNTPVAVGQGISAAVAGPGVDADQHRLADRLLRAVGELIWLKDEADLDLVTAMSGSGPAYFYRFAEALAEAGVAAGLPRDAASRLARSTFTGSAALAASRADALEVLRMEVTSPSGTTAAALATLEAADLGNVVETAVRAAVARARELAQAGSVASARPLGAAEVQS